MKYKVLAAGLSNARKNYTKGDGFPANVKGFDYESAIARGLIEENKDGKLPRRATKKTDSVRLQESTSEGHVDTRIDNLD